MSITTNEHVYKLLHQLTCNTAKTYVQIAQDTQSSCNKSAPPENKGFKFLRRGSSPSASMPSNHGSPVSKRNPHLGHVSC